MADHDALYHRLFSHPGMVAQLLREFVAEPWVETLDLEAMERVNAKFHGEAGERRDGDVIWRIPAGNGADVYIYLLLEFQSTPERWMALRAMVYVGLLWQQLIREKRLAPDGRLPPVLPIVLYNGDPRWAMPLGLRELIALPAESPFWRWQPDMAYHVVDEGAWPADELARKDSLAALLFRLEHCRNPDEVVGLVDALIGWFRGHPGFEALGPVFAMLAGRLIAGEVRCRCQYAGVGELAGGADDVGDANGRVEAGMEAAVGSAGSPAGPPAGCGQGRGGGSGPVA